MKANMITHKDYNINIQIDTKIYVKLNAGKDKFIRLMEYKNPKWIK